MLLVVLGPVLLRSALIFGLAIIVQSGLEFLGFGQSDRPSWGRMLSEAFQTFYRAPDLVYPPGVAIGLTAVCLVIVAAAAADTLGSERGGRRRRRPGAGAANSVAGTVVGENKDQPTRSPLTALTWTRVTPVRGRHYGTPDSVGRTGTCPRQRCCASRS